MKAIIKGRKITMELENEIEKQEKIKETKKEWKIEGGERGEW